MRQLRSSRFARALGLAAITLAAACTDRERPLLPAPPRQPGEEGALAAISCSANVSARTVTCRPQTGGAANLRASEVVYGGQHVYVELISGVPAVAADTFAFTTRVLNLIPQPIGTTDGATADPGGVKVFFASAPNVTQGTGTVSVANADGLGTFIATNQPYFAYVGILRTDSISPTRTWKLQFTAGVQAFTFTVFVSSPVPLPQGWVDVSPAATALVAGGVDTLRAIVHGPLGNALSPAGTAWSSSSPDSVSVTPLPGDSLAVVHALGRATATLTAASGPRTGHATVIAERDPSLVPRELTVTGAGTGDGVVSSTPAGILCSVAGGAAAGACSAVFPYGTAVTLSVTAAAGGHAFAEWSGACAGSLPSCGIAMTQARTAGAQLTAPAAPPAYRPTGLDFGPFVDGQNPDLGSVVSAEQVRARLVLTRSLTPWIRVFGSTGGLQHAPTIARELGLKVACSAWIDSVESANQREIAGLLSSIRAGNCDLAIVGSEVLRRQTRTISQLISYIRQVKQGAGAVPVTTADIYGNILGNPALIPEIDVVMMNVYPYFEKVPLQYALFHVDTVYRKVTAAAGGKLVYVSESGWPSCGESMGQAEPSPTNAPQYFVNFASWARSRGVTYFYFESFDEAWKAMAEKGPHGACWGIMDKYGVLKPGMQSVFDGVSVPDNWSGETVVGGAGTPSIAFTHVPPLHSTDELERLEGSVLHVKPVDHIVAVYIKVAGLWYVKPYADSRRAIRIYPDGTWVADITTGGNDQDATEIVAFLLPATFDPPTTQNKPSLDPSLAANAVASVSVVR